MFFIIHAIWLVNPFATSLVIYHWIVPSRLYFYLYTHLHPIACFLSKRSTMSHVLLLSRACISSTMVTFQFRSSKASHTYESVFSVNIWRTKVRKAVDKKMTRHNSKWDGKHKLFFFLRAIGRSRSSTGLQDSPGKVESVSESWTTVDDEPDKSNGLTTPFLSE